MKKEKQTDITVEYWSNDYYSLEQNLYLNEFIKMIQNLTIDELMDGLELYVDLTINDNIELDRANLKSELIKCIDRL